MDLVRVHSTLECTMRTWSEFTIPWSAQRGLGQSSLYPGVHNDDLVRVHSTLECTMRTWSEFTVPWSAQ